MKEKYIEFLNMAVVDTRPIKNSDFLKSVAIEVMFTLLIFIVSIFIEGEIHDVSMNIFHIVIYHLLALLFIFLLFQKFSKSKLLQIFPATSVLIFYIEFLFWSSIFLGDDYWSVFMVLISLSLVFQLLTFVYQLLIVPKAKTLPSGEFRKTILHIPSVIVICTAAIVIVIARLFMLPAVYVVTSLVAVSIGCILFYWFEYARVFTGWKKKSTNNFIYRGEIK
ncbi:lantibiotic ABC transporter permease [Streptococcus oralis]|uniref:Lantibiotic ABC transporter permease n=1 Tax=Streptococcus oralis TaxID=1303 RepID=A0AAW7WB32_STROR|nr:lantibiotic ABC transporter permease [Streptococcus oralis]MDO6344924.1 lantibiotic ABC transporter permease [Streptococcus oralis]MDO6348898.1 lantibiotic ABC transporter permease [Streptococcus oralis]MDO6349638.1 lantibiotic ABC transporter permease [Streptococcus oralis]